MITAVSLFAGVGGFDLAMQRAGIDVVAAVEIDKHAQKVLQRHFPMTAIHSDISEVTGEQLRADGFNPDNGIITGGFPCQDLSIAGTRRGLAGERSGLFWQIVRLIDELQPKWLILENVPGLLSSNKGADMGIVVGALERRGYGVAWRVLDAQHFGVAQRRRRLFFVCCLADHRRPIEILFEPESGIRHPAPRRKTEQDSARVIETGTSQNYYSQQRSDEYKDSNLAKTLSARDYKSATDLVMPENESEMTAFTTSSFGQYVEGIGTLRAQGGDFGGGSENLTIGFSHYQNVPNVSGDVSPTLGQESQAIVMRQREGKDGGGKGPLLSDKSLTLAAANDQTLFVSPTLTSYNLDSRSPQSSEQTNIVNAVHSVTSTVRRLTPKECERLQGFPDDWTAGQTDGHRYKQMGNAVAVPVVEWIVRRLVK